MTDGAAADRQFVVGVDGGNSKTDLVLARLDGTVVARVVGPGTRSSADGYDRTAADLAALLERAWDEARPALGDVVRSVLALANLDLPEEEADMASALERLGVFGRLEVGNDTLAVLQAGAPDAWGVAVVCGAGINAIGVAPDGRRERFLALGYHSGDWGGGASVALGALHHAVRAQDGRGGDTLLRRTLPAHFGMTEPSDITLALHRGTLTRLELLRAAPVVFAAAQDGDATARELVVRCGREAAVMAAALLRRLGVPSPFPPVVLGGSLLQSGDDILLGAFEAQLHAQVPGATYTVLHLPPVAGPVDEALRLAGAGPAARGRARASWTSGQG